MKKILLLTVGDEHTGSTRYRILQYLPFLEEHGYDFHWLRKGGATLKSIGKVDSIDLVFNQKSLFSIKKSKRITRVNRPIVFDFDDAIYTRPGKGYSLLTRMRVRRRLRFWLQKSAVVIVANGVLADYAKRYSRNVVVLPMSLDLTKWSPPKEKVESGSFSLGWIGSPGNLRYLRQIEGAIGKAISRCPRVRLKVFCGERPALSIPFIHYPYSPEKEVEFCQSIDLGLLPLRDDEYLRGKSPIKAIQYMACGVPVVGSAPGATSEILSPENSMVVRDDQEWTDAICLLANDPRLAKELGRKGRELVEENHDLRKNSKVLLEILEGLTAL
jgi:glycosyltransferase involved in cell wall biosynthesis